MSLRLFSPENKLTLENLLTPVPVSTSLAVGIGLGVEMEESPKSA
jgi:hypothetical protein